MRSKVVKNIAEQRLAVGGADRLIEPWSRTEAGELAVVGEHPVATPEFAHEGMGVGQAGVADVGLANVADGHFAFYWMSLDHCGDSGIGAGIGVVEGPYAFAFVKGDAPAVLVRAGLSTPTGQAGKAETQVSGGVGAHGQ